MIFVVKKLDQIICLFINIMVLCLWGFAGFGKVIEGVPSWFNDLFQHTFLATFPGLALSFWFITLLELIGFFLALISLIRREFLKKQLSYLRLCLAHTVFVFLTLEFGVLLANDLPGQERLFNYFVLSLVLYLTVTRHESLQKSKN